MKTNEIKNQLQQLHSELVKKAIDLTFKVQKQLEPFELSNGFTAIKYGAGYIVGEYELSNGFTAIKYGAGYIVGEYDGGEQNFTLHGLSDSDLLELISQLEDENKRN